MPSYLFDYKGHRVHVQVYTPQGGAIWAGEIVITSREGSQDVDRKYVPEWEKYPQSEDAAYHALRDLAHRIVDGQSDGTKVGNG